MEDLNNKQHLNLDNLIRIINYTVSAEKSGRMMICMKAHLSVDRSRDSEDTFGKVELIM